MVNVRLTRPGPIPTPQAILPYRHALVVNEYESWTSSQGRMRSARFRSPSGRFATAACSPQARKMAGAAFTLTVERYDAHPELEGERLISGSEASSLPLYYDVSPP